MAAAAPNNNGDILVVDDTPANLRLLSQILTERGYKVRAVTSGTRAIESALASPPDLILLDIRMPGMDGFEVCEHLKTLEATRYVPVIFISALDDVTDKVHAFHKGGVDYITKPFQIEEVLARTETHLALHDAQRQLQDANQRYERELALAGQIQASFLPRAMPEVNGWQIAARLAPSREMSGDFYDFIPLPDGRLGIVLADVVDKGAGAALFMALCWSLIRTYLEEHPLHPEQVFELVNRRILQDTISNEFVTAFLGVLDPFTGRLTYANAGHCPALLLHNGEIQRLPKTGMPLGVLEDSEWQQCEVDAAPGATFIFYTDGITEAFDPQGEMYGIERLERCVKECAGAPVSEIAPCILERIYAFAAKHHLDDDIALIVMKQGH